MRIIIHVQRPLLTAIVLAGIGFGVWYFSASTTVQTAVRALAIGGGTQDVHTTIESHETIRREQVKQAVLNSKEEILRYQLRLLEEQGAQSQTPESLQALRDARTVLLGIIKERTASEKLLTASLQQFWDAQGTGIDANNQTEGYTFDRWPVLPRQGISAYFEDASYEKIFHVPHHAIDIPTPFATPIVAPADGTVRTVADNGLGYSYLVLDHANGLRTVYGHVSSFLVTKGQEIRSGDTVALSGGTPGTKGAGLLTTGPHLHFAVEKKQADGTYALVNPLPYLTIGERPTEHTGQ